MSIFVAVLIYYDQLELTVVAKVAMVQLNKVAR